MPRLTRTTLLVLLLVMVGVPGRAEAYLDPGTGSLVLQLALAGLAAAYTAFRLFWSRIVRLFRREQKQGERPGLQD